jgi:hypothetical protein
MRTASIKTIGELRNFLKDDIEAFKREIKTAHSQEVKDFLEGRLKLDFGHSGINPLQTRQERAGVVRKFDEVWWDGRHHEITPPPMPLP